MSKIPFFYKVVTKEKLWRTEIGLKRYLDFLFCDIPFHGRTFLDIGGGVGVFSFYASILGARKVVCLEPDSAGSSNRTYEVFTRISDSLNLPTVTLLPVPIQEFKTAPCVFDIILLHNSINHLSEDDYCNIKNDQEAASRYQSIFDKIFYLASKGSHLVVADCSPNNFYTKLKIPHPICRTIEWHKHQPPELLVSMFQKSGFVDSRIHWSSFNRLGKLGWTLFSNKLGAFFLTSHFRIIMRKL